MTDVMFQAIRDQGYGPPIAARVYAIGHLAGFLAVNAIAGCYESPYPTPISVEHLQESQPMQPMHQHSPALYLKRFNPHDLSI